MKIFCVETFSCFVSVSNLLLCGGEGGVSTVSLCIHACFFSPSVFVSCVKCTCEWHCDRETEPSLCSMVLYANAATCFRDCISNARVNDYS